MLTETMHHPATIWVVSKHINIRKFYIYNLVGRGYPAIGLTNLAEQLNTFWPEQPPHLVILWGRLGACEESLRALYRHYTIYIPVIVVSRETPTREWMQNWHIAAWLKELSDSRELPVILQPWLSHEVPFSGASAD